MVSLHSKHAAGLDSEAHPKGIIQLSKPDAKLMHRFYEPLQLLTILNADRGPGEVDLPADPQSRDFRMILRRFLDNLSWLCDNKHGGETVSAVAAQSLPEGTKYWLVSRYKQSFDHLQWVLNTLEAVRGGGDQAVLGYGLAIARESMFFSKDKINNYVRFLRIAYKKAKDELARMSPIPSFDPSTSGDLFAEIEALLSAESNHLSLCLAAHDFQQKKKLLDLMQLLGSAEKRSQWYLVWHYIGRLGCWFGKCQQLALVVSQFPQLVDGISCEFLALPEERELPVDHSRADLSSALRRMLPANQQHFVGPIHEQLSGMRSFNIPEAFHENITKHRQMGQVHAEVFLLEHFFFNTFQFLMREKYVGCSKPSCYCCSLYMRYHPANVVMRPAHNNVYLKWIPPLMLQLDKEQVRKHNLDIMNSMNAYIRRDVREEIDLRIPRRDRAPDSTTGIDSLVVHTQ